MSSMLGPNQPSFQLHLISHTPQIHLSLLIQYRSPPNHHLEGWHDRHLTHLPRPLAPQGISATKRARHSASSPRSLHAHTAGSPPVQALIMQAFMYRQPVLTQNEQEPLDWSFNLPEALSLAAAGLFCLWYHRQRHWLANNALGLAFSIQGIEHLSVGAVQTGVILLSGLFFYDIFFVFFTPVMARPPFPHLCCPLPGHSGHLLQPAHVVRLGGCW